MEHKVEIKFSGVSATPRRDGQMTIKHFYLFNNAEVDIDSMYEEQDSNGDIPYTLIFGSSDIRLNKPMAINYTENPAYDLTDQDGLYSIGEQGNRYSFYRREYTIFEKDQGSKSYEFKGPWEPVAVAFDHAIFRDYNVKSNHTYQYIMYPDKIFAGQKFANAVEGQEATYGDPVQVEFDDWMIAELISEDNTLDDAPIIKKVYRVDTDNLWFFRYNLNTGSQKQNLSKNTINTLGTYARISHGNMNWVSGQVSCYLGSEIVPYNKEGSYVERMRQSVNHPLSTNEKTYMLDKWRKLVYSKNPKLLRDSKGQSWIVSILSSENETQTNYSYQPDKINFTWAEIESAKNTTIYSDFANFDGIGCTGSVWKPKITLTGQLSRRL